MRIRAAPRSPRRSLGLLAAALASCSSGPKTDEDYIEAFLEENPYVYEKLGSHEAARRQDIINGFLEMDPSQARTILRHLLDDPNTGSRGEAVAAGLLATKFKDPAAIPVLVEKLQGPRSFERQVAIDGLSAFGDRLVPQLAEIYATGLDENRLAAAQVLGRIGTPAAIRALRSRLAAEGTPEVRATAIQGILDYEGDDRVDYLIDCLTDPDPEIRRIVWNAIEKDASPPVRFDPGAPMEVRVSQIAELKAWRKGAKASAAGRTRVRPRDASAAKPPGRNGVEFVGRGSWGAPPKRAAMKAEYRHDLCVGHEGWGQAA